MVGMQTTEGKSRREIYAMKFNNYLDDLRIKSPASSICDCSHTLDSDFREVYLDYNATTPIRPEVREILRNYYRGDLGYANPSSPTMQGHNASELIFETRKATAGCLRTNESEIFFTSSGSESNNLALKGLAFKYMENKDEFHIISTKIEHKSVLNTLHYLVSLGFKVTFLDVNKDGILSVDSLKKAILPHTKLIAVMYANNEIGTLQPIKEIGDICRDKGILFACDAVQAFGKIAIYPKELGISLLTFSGHKIYAPKGVGGIYIENGISLMPQIHGGEQEGGLRSGTENVGSIIGFKEAVKISQMEMNSEYERIKSLRDFFLDGLKRIGREYVINGSLNERIPHNVSIGFSDIKSGELVLSLNKAGISVSTGSACSSLSRNNSHVIEAIGADTEKYAAIRFSFGLYTTKEDIIYTLSNLGKILHDIKKKRRIPVAADGWDREGSPPGSLPFHGKSPFPRYVP